MSAVALLEKAKKLMERRQVGDSLATYRALTAEFPRYAEGWFHRSGTESGLGHALSAVAAAREAVALEPGNTLYRAHLAQMQVNYGFWGDAIATLGPLLAHAPNKFDARIANTVGSVLSLCGLEDQAQPWFAAAATAAPQNPIYGYNHAQGLLHCGQPDAARDAFLKLVGRFPHYAKALWSLSTFEGKAGGQARLDQLRAALANAASPMDEILCCYALFNVLDALDRRGEAFFELESGMRLQRARIRYDGQDLVRMSQLPAAAERLSGTRVQAGEDDACPIFIVGLPRSGTTLVERIISNHPDVAQGGELFCFAAALHERLGVESGAGAILSSVPGELIERELDIAGVGARYLGLTAYKRGERRFLTDKFPFNFLLVPWIAHALPQARILHVYRDPMDTCFSNLKHLFARSYGASYSQEDMGRYYDAYHRLMRTWDTLVPGRVLQVKYEDLVADPQAMTARILDFCGLPPAPEAWRVERNAKPVATASTMQVRQPINARGIGAWRRYERELQPLVRFFASHPHPA
ncbi:MAG TPA: sulfotransferase [Lysobacter sp.]|nr:sulfotransferase [Lysobacter sp.]